MAKATAETKEIIESVDLKLSPEEAYSVALALLFVGGEPDLSARKYTDRVRRALNEAGIRIKNHEYTFMRSGSLFFADDSGQWAQDKAQ